MCDAIENRAVNPFDDLAVARRYEAWYVGEGKRADPVADQSYDVTALITMLEFLSDPECALLEALNAGRSAVPGTAPIQTLAAGYACGSV